MKLSRLEAKIPPLRDIPLNTRPLTKRALAWSCDGELAVAADDSVHVFVPLFPDPWAVDDGDEAAPEEEEADVTNDEDEDKGNVDLRPAFLRQKRKTVARTETQFSSGHRQILVSHPRLQPKVNRELFDVAGLPFVSAEGVAGSGTGGRGRRGDEGSDGESDDLSVVEEEDSADEAYASEGSVEDELTLGAGRGVISSAGSSMNHVVGIAWSPSGLGRNRRAVLAVLTSAGYIGFYGDGFRTNKTGTGVRSTGKEDGMLKQRDLSSWAVLFGAGERFLVPGQLTKASQNVRSVAWAREVAPSQALLAYINDDQEVAVLSIQSTSAAAADHIASEGSPAPTEDNMGKMTWIVREVARFKADGPHPAGDSWDPDWVPCGTAFGLRWSPWLSSNNSRTCILSYFARNYVGFRKITLKAPWARGTVPEIMVDEADIYGHCTFLSTDGFVEFEDAIWTKSQSEVVRGFIVTGFHVKPFGISIIGPQPSSFRPESHSTNDCGTTYIDHTVDRPSTNPIVDLIIHPPKTATPSATPTYTLVRLSATSTNHDWFQTNADLPDFTSETGIAEAKPQWVVDLEQKLAVLVPADAHMRRVAGVDGDSDADSIVSGKEPGDADSDDELSDYDVEVDIEKAAQAPEVHPTRFRIHGLAAAPGGRVTAALVSAHSTQTPDRIGSWGLRSMLVFGSVERPKRSKGQQEDMMALSLRGLTTEGRMLNWMYGAGPDVPGITSERHDEPSDGTANGGKIGIRQMFREVIASQKCDLCGEDMAASAQAEGRPGMTICQQGHFFSTCGASGLAIQAPGLSHTCGVCGLQTLKIGELLKKVPSLEMIKKELAADICGNCGGKFVD